QRTNGKELRFCRCPVQGADDQGAGIVRALPALVMSHARTLRQLVLLSSMVSTTACKLDMAEQQKQQQQQQKQQQRAQVPAAPKNTVPVVGVALDQSEPSNNGLLKTLDGNGSPVRDGAAMDPAILEARRFYDTLKAPNAQPVLVDYPDPFTGAP